jgi:hypothetical protein
MCRGMMAALGVSILTACARHSVAQNIPPPPPAATATVTTTAKPNKKPLARHPRHARVALRVVRHNREFRAPMERRPSVPPVAAPQLSITVQQDRADLAWTPVSNARIYRVSRSNALEGPYIVIADNLPATASAYTDLGVRIGLHYYYQVSAVHDGLAKSSTAKGWYIAPPEPTGGIEIRTNVNADVIVDRNDTGPDNGDHTIKSLAVGQHTVKVSATGYQPQTFSVWITNDVLALKTVQLDSIVPPQQAAASPPPPRPSGEIYVASSGLTDDVTIDSTDYGSSPVDVRSAPGDYTVTVKIPGLPAYMRKLTVTDGAKTTMRPDAFAAAYEGWKEIATLRYGDAAAAARRALGMDSNSSLGNGVLAIALMELAEGGQAEEGLAGDNVGGDFERAVADLARGLNDASISEVQKASAEAPSDAYFPSIANVTEGDAYVKAKNYEQAVIAYKAAVSNSTCNGDLDLKIAYALNWEASAVANGNSEAAQRLQDEAATNAQSAKTCGYVQSGSQGDFNSAVLKSLDALP